MLRTVLTYTGCVVLDDACANVPVPRWAVEQGLVSDPELRLAIGAVVEAVRRHVGESRT